MNLHSSYETVKLSLLTQPTEPTLEVIRSILNSSSPIIDAPFAIKSEPTDTALATKFKKKDSHGTHSVMSHRNDVRHSSHGCSKSNQGRKYWMRKDSVGEMLPVTIVTGAGAKDILPLYVWPICHLP